jgi:hypothetical protein
VGTWWAVDEGGAAAPFAWRLRRRLSLSSSGRACACPQSTITRGRRPTSSSPVWYGPTIGSSWAFWARLTRHSASVCSARVRGAA